MLTSFFSKSKPINFIIVSIYLIGGCFFWLFFKGNVDFIASSLLIISLSILTYLFLLFSLNFIIKKNKLTKNNTYSILFFSAFMIMFPSVYEENSVVLSNVFLLLALRRILSLPSDKNTEKKILDASLWITIAALFYFWSLLFFVVLFFAIFQLNSKNYKQFIIPIVGFSTVFVLITVYFLLVNDSFLWFLEINTNIGFDFNVYKSTSISIFLVLLALLVSIFQKVVRNKITPLKQKLKQFILLIWLFLSVFLIVITPSKNGSEFIFLFVPLAVFLGNFIENSSKKWISELILWIAVLSPFLIYIL